MDALRDNNINLIGVWGMGGVGKTTLVKQVAQQAKQQHLFTTQVYIDLSSIPDSQKLRQKIANALAFTLWEQNESRKADQLKKRLKERKILIILDDIWREVNLEEVGIPSEGDSVEENLQLRPMAIQVVEECEGLPIAIVTIAKSFKDENVDVWKNALEQLGRSAPTNIRGVGKKEHSCLEWSYTHLKGDDVQSLFLLSGMLGYGDISMDHLLQYGMGLDLFVHIDSLEQARNRLLALVEILKASGLLLDSHEDGHNFEEERASSLLFMNANNKLARMHDVVREVA
ncbi:Disease resistance protein [Vitis vinifera]|uniref:Disease resistance protein n=1 Tax=Vitis vinifera TaxID=29760 RepID=A0A438FX58_VITVI|nr:Disease resistance protein [Vitis vinifera]